MKSIKKIIPFLVFVSMVSSCSGETNSSAKTSSDNSPSLSSSPEVEKLKEISCPDKNTILDFHIGVGQLIYIPTDTYMNVGEDFNWDGSISLSSVEGTGDLDKLAFTPQGTIGSVVFSTTCLGEFITPIKITCFKIKYDNEYLISQPEDITLTCDIDYPSKPDLPPSYFSYDGFGVFYEQYWTGGMVLDKPSLYFVLHRDYFDFSSYYFMSYKSSNESLISFSNVRYLAINHEDEPDDFYPFGKDSDYLPIPENGIKASGDLYIKMTVNINSAVSKYCNVGTDLEITLKNLGDTFTIYRQFAELNLNYITQ